MYTDEYPKCTASRPTFQDSQEKMSCFLMEMLTRNDIGGLSLLNFFVQPIHSVALSLGSSL